MLNRAPVENRRSFPDSARTQQLLEEYCDGYGSSSTAGGSTSGYGSGGRAAFIQGWDLAERSERGASVPKVAGSSPSGGSESTSPFDVLLTVRGSST
jgi:hypothetical protein